MITLSQLNLVDEPTFVAICGPVFEHSPWVAEQTWPRRPFASVEKLHQELCRIVQSVNLQAKLALIGAHPDLVGRLARQGQLTAHSKAEQTTAGLTTLTDDEVDQFQRYNNAYHDKFGFPFIICARQNKKEAILAAFPERLMQSREDEIATALLEIYAIAKYRLLDAVSD